MEDFVSFFVGLFDLIARDASARPQGAGLLDPNALEFHWRD
jgi:hypothetical protein